MLNNQSKAKDKAQEASENNNSLVPSISLPKGGGAIRGIGEKFSTNPVTGAGSLSVPLFTTPGRAGFSPQLSLSYDPLSIDSPSGLSSWIGYWATLSL